MAKSKTELLNEAKAMGLDLTSKNTVSEITSAMAAMSQTPIEPIENGQLETARDGEQDQVQLAKAGKRSQKGLEESAEKLTKIEHQRHRDDPESQKDEKTAVRRPVTPTRSRLARRSKGFRKSAELIESNKLYTLSDGLKVVTKTSTVKFDATIELHVNLNVDPRQADQNIRDSVVLPSGTGKKIRVAVFADENSENSDISGIETISKLLDKGTIDFDILVSTQPIWLN